MPTTVPSQMMVPGSMTAFTPVFTSSPMMTPSLRRPELSIWPLVLTLTMRSSKRRLATLVPAPKLQRSPTMLSPT